MKKLLVNGKKDDSTDEIFDYCKFCIYLDECDLTEEDFEEAGLDECPYFEETEEESA